MMRMKQFETTELLKKIADLQSAGSLAVTNKNLSDAHYCLKRCAILLFENSGPEKLFPLSFSVPFFLILFRAGYYLENEDGDYLYRYEAIPGQLANACHFQLRLSQSDGSGSIHRGRRRKNARLQRTPSLELTGDRLFFNPKKRDSGIWGASITAVTSYLTPT